MRKEVLLLLAATALAACHPEAAHESGVTAAMSEAVESLSYAEAATVIQTGLPASVLSQVEGPSGFFRVSARKGELERFRCSVCHVGPPVRVKGAAAMAHGDIALKHGGDEGRLDCETCHDDAERDFLVGADETKIDFDHSYQLCGTCHFRQKKDWAGGAHGKRETYWAGTRVVRNCTGCHDPHSPRFARRWPATFSPPLDDEE